MSSPLWQSCRLLRMLTAKARPVVPVVDAAKELLVILVLLVNESQNKSHVLLDASATGLVHTAWTI